MEKNKTNVVLFDGVCNLCNSSVQFIIKRDTKAVFKFASLQSEVGQSLLKKFDLPIDNFDSFVFISDNHCYQRTAAALNVLKRLGGVWKLFYVLIIFPAPVRDCFYNLIANNRYKIFGKHDACMIPTPEIKQRFLS